MMHLGLRIACILKIVGALVGCKSCEDSADRGADGFDGARGGLAQAVLKTCSIGFRSGEYCPSLETSRISCFQNCVR